MNTVKNKAKVLLYTTEKPEKLSLDTKWENYRIAINCHVKADSEEEAEALIVEKVERMIKEDRK